MVATVGSIAIDLSTNVAKFASGFKSAATTVDRESNRMAKSIATVDRASKAAGGVLSGFVGGIVAGGALAAFRPSRTSRRSAIVQRRSVFATIPSRPYRSVRFRRMSARKS
jgi:hypothetical protein